MNFLTRRFLKTLVAASALASMVLAVATIPRLVLTDPTNSLNTSTGLYSGSLSYSVPNVGYHLTQVAAWTNSNEEMVGFEMTFTPDVAGPAPITQLIGSTTGGNGPYNYLA